MKKNPNLDPAGPLRDPQSQTMTDKDDLGYLRRTLRQWQDAHPVEQDKEGVLPSEF